MVDEKNDKKKPKSVERPTLWQRVRFVLSLPRLLYRGLRAAYSFGHGPGIWK